MPCRIRLWHKKRVDSPGTVGYEPRQEVAHALAACEALGSNYVEFCGSAAQGNVMSGIPDWGRSTFSMWVDGGHVGEMLDVGGRDGKIRDDNNGRLEEIGERQPGSGPVMLPK